MAYGGFKDLPRRTTSDKRLHDKAFNVAKKPKFDEYQRGLRGVARHLQTKHLKGSNLLQ